MKFFTDKYFVFLISGGRTGTKFFGNYLQKIVMDSFSVHEPDVLKKISENYSSIIKKIQSFGFYHMILGRILNQTGIRNLSQKYLAGKLPFEDLNSAIIRHRKKYYENISSNLIIEAYSAWYGCIPAIQNLYSNYKIIIITRDPREWVASVMNRGALFGKNDWVTKLKIDRLNPIMVNDQHYSTLWNNFNKFQKICWTYKFLYETMLENIKNDKNVLVIKFENLFYNQDRYKNLSHMLDFMTEFENKKFHYKIPPGILDKQLNRTNAYNFPNYKEWNNSKKKQFEDICFSVMKELKYTDIN